MDVLECIITRRSIRDFLERDVSEEDIQKILKCAMYAPSAGNQRPWHFVVIKSRETMMRITQFHPHSMMLKSARCAIAVVADTEIEKHKGYWVQDCSAAVQNILLSVHYLGLGAVWLGIYPREERINGLSKLLNLPSNIVPFAVVAIGYPAKIPEQPDRFEENRIHYEKW